jgi:hypothetical protein
VGSKPSVIRSPLRLICTHGLRVHERVFAGRDQERALAGLGHAVALGAQHSDGGLVAVRGEQRGEQRPQLEDGGNLLQRDHLGRNESA